MSSKIFIQVELKRVRCSSALSSSKGLSKLHDLDATSNAAEKTVPVSALIFRNNFVEV